jgi:serine/threonine protein kinase
VLLDRTGHCKLSDLGLAVTSDRKIKGYAGTPGYCAPEMIKGRYYGFSVDVFSFGVMLYRMLSGQKPFRGKRDRDLDKAVTDQAPQFQREIFSKHAISLLTGLLDKKPEKRLGVGGKGIQDIKDHPFFEEIDWGLLEAGYLEPPFIPSKYYTNAPSLKEIGDFDKDKYKSIKLDDRFKNLVKDFPYISTRALQDEMVKVLEKADEGVNFEKFASKKAEAKAKAPPVDGDKCCVLA